MRVLTDTSTLRMACIIQSAEEEQVALEGMRLALWGALNAGRGDEGRDRRRSVTRGG